MRFIIFIKVKFLIDLTQNYLFYLVSVFEIGEMLLSFLIKYSRIQTAQTIQKNQTTQTAQKIQENVILSKAEMLSVIWAFLLSIVNFS
jgi:hypothetical protein